MHGNGVFRNLHEGCENFQAPKITENMHFITTKCIVTFRHEIFPEFSRHLSYIFCVYILCIYSVYIFCVYILCIYSVCSLSVSNAGTARHKSSQASGVYTMSIFTSMPIYYNSLIFCIVRVCTSLLILKLSYVTSKQ